MIIFCSINIMNAITKFKSFIMILTSVLVICAAVLASALPNEPVIRKLDPQRYHYMAAGDGSTHLVDLWMTAGDLEVAARYNPERQNVYHLFTRANPTVSQPLLMGNNGLIGLTNYNPARRTIILIHGWMTNVDGDFNRVLVPAFLAAEDVNVIVVDWSAGSGTINYIAAVTNTLTSGQAVAEFINWLNGATGANAAHYHLVGHSLGAHQVGIIGRNVNGNIAYITGLEAALPGWLTSEHILRAEDGTYVEHIHTNAGFLGYLTPLGHVSFYPNGGRGMPGCNSNDCDHARSYFYLGESLTGGIFTGRRCLSYLTAISNNCNMLGTLRMGGLVPKTGSSGIFHLETNAAPPFARG